MGIIDPMMFQYWVDNFSPGSEMDILIVVQVDLKRYPGSQLPLIGYE
jgi:hypothetical protein